MGSVCVREREGRRAPGFIPALHYASKGYHGNQLIRPLSATTRRSITSILSLSHCFSLAFSPPLPFPPITNTTTHPILALFPVNYPSPLALAPILTIHLAPHRAVVPAPQRVNRARRHSSGRQFRLHLGKICPVS